jgi:hypothetical protein
MAITINQKRKFNSVRVYSEYDPAIDHESSDWEAYKADPVTNLSAIKMKANETATAFICNFDLDGDQVAKVKDAMIKGLDEERNLQLSYGKWANQIVRMTLRGIENPKGVEDVIEFKKDGRGWADARTIGALEKVGVVQEIFNHYINLTQNPVRAEIKNS